MSKNKHLTLSERQTIEDMLYNKRSFSDIARSIGKSLSTVTNEVKGHTIYKRVGTVTANYNKCKKRFGCKKACICHPCNSARKYAFCRRCSMCNRFCPDYEPDICQKHLKVPYVCNGCGRRPECVLEKRLYKAEVANKEYRQRLSEARAGMSYSEEDLELIDSIVSPLIRNGQSPHHVCIANRDSLMVSERTIYRLIDLKQISARNLDLPRKVRFKPRKKKLVFKVDKACRQGRDYLAYQDFYSRHPELPLVELDSVEGKKGGKVLLTIHFVQCEMMLAFLRDCNDSRSVTNIFNTLYELLGREIFCRIFGICLADNGSEFTNPKAIEFDSNGEQRTYMFYCDPSAPYEKGAAENNHEFIRRFIPKGVDIGLYSPADINLMMDHINSYSRDKIGNRSPYEVFRFFFGDEALNRLGCTTIPPQKVVLNKSIFNRRTVQ